MKPKTEKILFGVSAVLLGVTVYSAYKRMQKPDLYIKNKLWFGAKSFTLPPVGVFVRKDMANDADTLAKELCNWQRFQQKGLVAYYVGNGVRAVMPVDCANEVEPAADGGCVPASGAQFS